MWPPTWVWELLKWASHALHTCLRLPPSCARSYASSTHAPAWDPLRKNSRDPTGGRSWGLPDLPSPRERDPPLMSPDVPDPTAAWLACGLPQRPPAVTPR